MGCLLISIVAIPCVAQESPSEDPAPQEQAVERESDDSEPADTEETEPTPLTWTTQVRGIDVKSAVSEQHTGVLVFGPDERSDELVEIRKALVETVKVQGAKSAIPADSLVDTSLSDDVKIAGSMSGPLQRLVIARLFDEDGGTLVGTVYDREGSPVGGFITTIATEAGERSAEEQRGVTESTLEAVESTITNEHERLEVRWRVGRSANGVVVAEDFRDERVYVGREVYALLGSVEAKKYDDWAEQYSDSATTYRNVGLGLMGVGIAGILSGFLVYAIVGPCVPDPATQDCDEDIRSELATPAFVLGTLSAVTGGFLFSWGLTHTRPPNEIGPIPTPKLREYIRHRYPNADPDEEEDSQKQSSRNEVDAVVATLSPRSLSGGFGVSLTLTF